MGRVKRGRGEMRRAGGGYWKRSGSVKDIVCGGVEGVVIGVRKCFVFYLGEVGVGRSGVRTKWAEASYVLCRVFAKSHHRCNISNNVLKSSHENLKTVRHIGIQCDDTPSPIMTGSGMIKRSSIDSAENNGSKKICTPSGKISDGPPAAVQVRPNLIIPTDYMRTVYPTGNNSDFRDPWYLLAKGKSLCL
ncbi:No apical meristem (NAM) protein [Artemisia annua]|uniref:No apical meristem (NAM) protein n=1 Tax=Artemisia annua TaxID=35608 RepID=A0A2U1NGY7_ARTAN|nr:No apical meristem (NAM) protein [Artemisia annua]